MSLIDLNPTGRFSDRVSDYERYRPSYPSALLDYLDQRIGGLIGARVADVGAGTGILSRLLLDRGASVDIVEPNGEMRAAAVRTLTTYPQFVEHDGTAENTGLPTNSIDLITCAQAFHWFEPIKTRREFDRILKSRGMTALIWNDSKERAGLGQGYKQIKIQYGGENFKKVSNLTRAVDDSFREFFGAKGFESKVFDNYKEVDRQGLLGRFFSSSYAP